MRRLARYTLRSVYAPTLLIGATLGWSWWLAPAAVTAFLIDFTVLRSTHRANIQP